jgi:multiple sugar transport system ATP-binding protein
MAHVVLEHLTKIFPVRRGGPIRAVHDLTLAVAENEFLVVVGPSGSGKTTLLRLIAGLEQASSGSISLDGKLVNDVEPALRDVALVFQNYALYPHMTVYENISFGLKLRKLPRSEIEQRVGEAAQLLQLEPCLGRKPGELSGGERQRTAVARALARRARLILFDEPFANLDTPMRLQMRSELAALHARLKPTIIYVTHDQGEALSLGHRVVVLHQGELQQVDEPEALYSHPVNRFVAEFVGSPPMNFFHGKATSKDSGLWFEEQRENGDAKDCVNFQIPKQHLGVLGGMGDKQVLLGIRPEHTLGVIAKNGQGGNVVRLIERIGRDTYAHIGRDERLFTARVTHLERVMLNQRVSLSIDPAQTHFFDPATGKALT